MIEIPMLKVFDLLDNRAFMDSVGELKDAGKLTVSKKYGANLNDKALFIFLDKNDELVFKIKYGELIND
jgi:hypothetical protein